MAVAEHDVRVDGRATIGLQDRCRQSSRQSEWCHRITVSGRTMATALTAEGNSLVTAAMVNRSRDFR